MFFLKRLSLLLPPELLDPELLDPLERLLDELPHDEPELFRELPLNEELELLRVVEGVLVVLFLFPKPLVVGFCLEADVVVNDFCEVVGAAIDLALAVTLLADLLALGLEILRVEVVVLGVLRVMVEVLVVVETLLLYELYGALLKGR